MTTDGGQDDSSGPPVPHYGEQSQGDKPELDAYGLPVQGRPAKDHRSAGGSGGVIVVAGRAPRWDAIIATVFCGGIAALAPLVPRLVKHHVPVPGVAAYLALVVAASIWGCSRGWRMELRIDDAVVTVRNYFRIYRISWPEVSHFADGAAPMPGKEGETSWALSIVLHSGQAVTASATIGGWPRPETLTAIRRAADDHGIPAELTGVAASRSYRWFLLAWLGVWIPVLVLLSWWAAE